MRVRMPDQQGDRARNPWLEVQHGDAQQRRPDACHRPGRRLGRLQLCLRGKDRARPRAARLSVTSTLERVGQRGDLVAIRSTVTRTNVGQAEVRVLGLTYNVVGVRTRFGDTPAAVAMPEQLPRSSKIAQAGYYEEPEGGEVILRYGVLFEGATALPSERWALNPGRAPGLARRPHLRTLTQPGSTPFGSRWSCPTRRCRNLPCLWFLSSSRDGRIAAVPGRDSKQRRRGAGPWSRPTSARSSPSGDLEPITDAARWRTPRAAAVISKQVATTCHSSRRIKNCLTKRGTHPRYAGAHQRCLARRTAQLREP